MTEQTKDFISVLNEINNSLRYNVFAPTLQQTLTFKQLTTKQFKNILQTLNTNTAGIEFNKVFVDILKENIQEQGPETIDQLTIFDLYIIALYTRIFCISETYSIYISPDEQKQYSLSNVEVVVNLKEIVEAKDKTPFSQEIFTEDNISIICNIPLQVIETGVNNFLEELLKTEEKTENVLGTLFTLEISKAIRTVQINETVVNFYNITLEEQKEIVEQLPISLINKVIKYVELYKDAFADFFLIDIPATNKNNESIRLQKVLEYNATLFNY